MNMLTYPAFSALVAASLVVVVGASTAATGGSGAATADAGETPVSPHVDSVSLGNDPSPRAVAGTKNLAVKTPRTFRIKKRADVRYSVSNNVSCRVVGVKVRKKRVRKVKFSCTPPAVPVVDFTVTVRSKKKPNKVKSKLVPLWSLGSSHMHTFLSTGPAGPDRWNPCVAAIPVRTNLNGVPASEGAVLADAVAMLRNASGLPLIVTGSTSFIPKANVFTDDSAKGEIVAAWADPGDAPNQSDALGSSMGRGGSRLHISGTTEREVREYAYGSLVVNRVLLSQPYHVRVQVYAHEVAHALGLGHYEDGQVSQVMNPYVAAKRPAVLGWGDRAGLARLGASAGCIR
jgi:hypothetical protein